ncbi:MAG: deoxyribodipyrimidine photo-lyase [Rickettsiales bacterium]|nr:deoxyribodipyrimidine photo-lyase [Rickettsiales bacterium]
MTKSNSFNIIWFKRDLRISDHEPLFAAAKNSNPTFALYIFEHTFWQLPDSSKRHWHFIHNSLIELKQDLASINLDLIIRSGDVITIFHELKSTLKNIEIFSHEETHNHFTYQRDLELKKYCNQNNVNWHEFQTNAVIRRLKNRDDWAKLRTQKMRQNIILAPTFLNSPHITLDCGQIPKINHDIFNNEIIGDVQEAGRKFAIKTLDSFVNSRASDYIKNLSKPGISARSCSRLSCALTYGNLSVREVEQTIFRQINSLNKNHNCKISQNLKKNLLAVISRIAWRCHFIQKLESSPEIEFKCMHPAFENLRPQELNQDFYHKFTSGQTGYPLIDAAMLSLKENGWITFRMRAMLVSFASYHLWLDWRYTKDFMATLFSDYEPGIHYSQFQMQSGVTGINTIRIYNPIKQSLDHDKDGKFIKRYLPQLKNIPTAFIHQPHLLEDCHIDYPKPIVNHEQATKDARQKLKKFRQMDKNFAERKKHILKKLASKKSTPTRIKKIKKDPNQMELF